MSFQDLLRLASPTNNNVNNGSSKQRYQKLQQQQRQPPQAPKPQQYPFPPALWRQGRELERIPKSLVAKQRPGQAVRATSAPPSRKLAPVDPPPYITMTVKKKKMTNKQKKSRNVLNTDLNPSRSSSSSASSRQRRQSPQHSPLSSSLPAPNAMVSSDPNARRSFPPRTGHSYVLHGKVHYMSDYESTTSTTTSSSSSTEDSGVEEKKQDSADHSMTTMQRSASLTSSYSYTTNNTPSDIVSMTSSSIMMNQARKAIQSRSKFAQLVHEVQQFQKLVADLEHILNHEATKSPEAAWRARILIRSAQDADKDLASKLIEYEKGLLVDNNNNDHTAVNKENDQQKQQHMLEKRKAQSACMKLHRDFKRIHRSLTMSLSLYEKRQHAEVSTLGAVEWSQKASAAAAASSATSPTKATTLIDTMSSSDDEEDYFDRALRQVEMNKIQQKMESVNGIYQELATIVEHQQHAIDVVQEQTEEAKYQVQQAAAQVRCLHDHQSLMDDVKAGVACGRLDDVQGQEKQGNARDQNRRLPGGCMAGDSATVEPWTFSLLETSLLHCENMEGNEKIIVDYFVNTTGKGDDILIENSVVIHVGGAVDGDNDDSCQVGEDAIEVECSENFEIKPDTAYDKMVYTCQDAMEAVVMPLHPPSTSTIGGAVGDKGAYMDTSFGEYFQQNVSIIQEELANMSQSMISHGRRFESESRRVLSSILSSPTTGEDVRRLLVSPCSNGKIDQTLTW